MKGIITEIQRFSLHDGFGIRTTVFLKGCNMQCLWCHNPETIKRTPQLQFFPDRCIGCKKCIKNCPNGVHGVVNNNRVMKRELCTNYGRCTTECYAEALVMAGKEMKVQDVLKEIMEDYNYYIESGGGLTLSGGEPLVQKEFAYEILKSCKENGVHTAIETNISLPWDHISYVLPVTDLIMFDIKIMDDNLHKKWTGISNKQILQNAKKLSKKNIPLIARTPIIPDVNDSYEEICKIAEYISVFPNLLYYELLPYNPFGVQKYESLGIKNNMPSTKAANKKEMKRLAQIAGEYNIKIRSGT